MVVVGMIGVGGVAYHILRDRTIPSLSLSFSLSVSLSLLLSL